MCARRGKRDDFARYVWVRVETEALRRLETFDKVLGMVRIETTTQARSAYLTLMYETLGMLDPPRCEFDIRLVRDVPPPRDAPGPRPARDDCDNVSAQPLGSRRPGACLFGLPGIEGRPEARREAQAAVQVVAGAPARLSAWLKAR